MHSFGPCLYTHPLERDEDPLKFLDGLTIYSANEEEVEAQGHEASIGDHGAGQAVPD